MCTSEQPAYGDQKEKVDADDGSIQIQIHGDALLSLSVLSLLLRTRQCAPGSGPFPGPEVLLMTGGTIART